LDAQSLAQTIPRHWGDAIAVRDLDGLAQLFAENAVFIATAPAPLVGHAAIRSYYAAAPAGLTVEARLLAVTPQREGFGIVADVVFHVPGRVEVSGRLGLACTSSGQIAHYHLALNAAQS
jgi:hypothetical protein